MAATRKASRAWTRYTYPTVAIVCGAAAGLVLLAIMFLLGSPFSGGATWDTPALMEYMDCSKASICRHFAAQEMQIVDGAGGHFEVTANSIGFRVPEPPPIDRDAASLVVQLYGDSMIHGTGVDDRDTIAQQLQEILARKFPRRNTSVMNFGMPMNYLASQLKIYETWGRDYRPDIVVFEYHGSIPSPRDINYRVRQIRESTIAGFLFNFGLGRDFINKYQTWSIGWFDREDAIEALRPGVDLVIRDHRGRGVGVAVFSFVSDFSDLDAIFPSDLPVVRIASGFEGWEGYRASGLIIPGDGHPNPNGTRVFAEAIAGGLTPLLPRE